MNSDFEFVVHNHFGREKESSRLEDILIKEILPKKNNKTILVRGPLGVGKTRLINEFIKFLSSQRVANLMPDFNPHLHIIRYNYGRNARDTQPYEAFKKIQEEIDKKNKKIRLLSRLARFFLSIFGINDMLDAAQNVINEARDSKSENEKARKILSKEFNRYKKYLHKRSEKVPLIIVIENVQNMDLNSLDLIESLIYFHSEFNGLLILEKEEFSLHSDFGTQHSEDKEKIIVDRLLKFEKDNVIESIQLAAFSNLSFPNEFLASEFGENFFTSQENDLLFSFSAGLPKALIDFIKNCINSKLLYRSNGKWHKKEDFKDQIIPTIVNFIELIRRSYQDDNKLDEMEWETITNTAHAMKINPAQVDLLVNMVIDISDLDLYILGIVDKGIFTNQSFLAYDSKNRRYIIEYASISQDHPDIFLQSSAERNEKFILETQQVKIGKKGMVIVWDYHTCLEISAPFYLGRKIFISNTLKQIIEFTEMIHNKFHSAGRIVGTLFNFVGNKVGTPPYFKDFDEESCKHLDNYIRFILYSHNLKEEQLFYLAPEILKQRLDFHFNSTTEFGKLPLPSIRSDVYTLGVHLYKSFMDQFPFVGNDEASILSSINSGSLDFDNNRRIISSIPNELRSIIENCLNKDPEGRYQDAGELNRELKKLQLDESIESGSAEQINPPKVFKKSKVKKFAYSVSILAAIIFAAYFILQMFKSDKIIDKVIILENAEYSAGVQFGKLTHEHIEYLLTDEFNQSSNYSVMSRDKFEKMYGSDSEAKYEIRFSLIKKENYNIKISVNETGGLDNTYSEILIDESQIFPIIKKIVRDVVKQDWKESTFTNDWDAFTSFFEGELAWRKLDKSIAMEKFEDAVTRDRNFLLARLRLADVYRFDEEFEKAKFQLQAVYGMLDQLSQVDSLKAVALNFRLNGDLFAAARIYGEIVAKSDRAEDYYERGEIYYEARDIENADDCYVNAIKRDSLFALAYNHLGYCYSHKGMHNEAIDAFKQYIKLDNTANSFDSMGDGYFAAGILDSAISAKKTGIEKSPNIDYLYSTLAHIYLRAGEIDSSKLYLEKYSAKANSLSKLANLSLFRALYHFMNGEFAPSRDTLEKAIIRYDQKDINRNNQIHWLLGLAYFELQETQKLISEYNSFMALIDSFSINATNYNESYKFMLHLRAMIAITNNDVSEFEKVAKEFNGSIRVKIKDGNQPFGVEFFNNWFGEAYLKYFNNDKLAEGYFKKSLAYNPYFALAHYNLRELYTRRGDQKNTQIHSQKLNTVWRNADAVIKTKYRIN